MKRVRFKDTVEVLFIPEDEERGANRDILMRKL